MDRLIKRYSAQRENLGDWLDAVEDPNAAINESDAYTKLSDAGQQRGEVRDAMNVLSVPREMQESHSRLVTMIDDGIEAVSEAYDGLVDADSCYTTCFYRDTSGWKFFHAESERITKEYAEALTAWNDAVTASQREIEGRKLPAKPVV